MASGNVNEPQPTTSTESTTDYDDAEYGWTSPTGTTFAIWYGMAPAGTVAFGQVGLVTGDDPRPILGPKHQTTNGFYVLAVPNKPGDAVGFYNVSGEVFTAAGGGVTHGPAPREEVGTRRQS